MSPGNLLIWSVALSSTFSTMWHGFSLLKGSCQYKVGIWHCHSSSGFLGASLDLSPASHTANRLPFCIIFHEVLCSITELGAGWTKILLHFWESHLTSYGFYLFIKKWKAHWAENKGDLSSSPDFDLCSWAIFQTFDGQLSLKGSLMAFQKLHSHLGCFYPNLPFLSPLLMVWWLT